jgi:hypothetical protein
LTNISKHDLRRLSPIDGQNVQSKRPPSNVEPAASSISTSLGQLTKSRTSERGENEETCLSIQQYAPPVINPLSTMDTQALRQSGWSAQLAESMDLKRPHLVGDAALARKKARV